MYRFLELVTRVTEKMINEIRHPYIIEKRRTQRCAVCRYMYMKDNGMIRKVDDKWLCIFCKPEQTNGEDMGNKVELGTHLKLLKNKSIRLMPCP